MAGELGTGTGTGPSNAKEDLVQGGSYANYWGSKLIDAVLGPYQNESQRRIDAFWLSWMPVFLKQQHFFKLKIGAIEPRYPLRGRPGHVGYATGPLPVRLANVSDGRQKHYLDDCDASWDNAVRTIEEQ